MFYFFANENSTILVNVKLQVYIFSNVKTVNITITLPFEIVNFKKNDRFLFSTKMYSKYQISSR